MISLFSDLQSSIDPGRLLAELDLPLFEWQKEALDPQYSRVIVVAARQSGKSTVAAGDVHHSGRYYPDSLNIIVSPSEQQSKETMKKVDELIRKDPDVELIGDASFEKTYISGARVIALPGTERSVRGYSRPRRLVLDESSRIEDGTYKATRPYFVDNPEGRIIAVSTPHGRAGWFYEAWAESKNWHKILVKPAYKLDNTKTKVIPDEPEHIFKEKNALLGISAHYSPRHTQKFLQEELEEMGWWWWDQEFGCKFLESGFSPFDMGAVLDSIDASEVLFKEDDHLTDDDDIMEFI